MRRRLGVAIIGAGLVGSKRARAITAAGGRVAIVIDADASRASALAAEMRARSGVGWTAAVAPDVDAVVVATPHHLLYPATRVALEAGRHVLCEKPLATRVKDAQHLVDIAAERKLVLKTGFNHRHHPAVARAHERLPEIGRPIFARCRYGHGGRPGYEHEWRGRPELSGGGELLDQGIHAIDLFRWFLGEIATVQGMTMTAVWPVAPLEDNAFAMIETEGGAIASLHASWTQWQNLFTFEVYGEAASLTVEGLGGSYGEERLVVTRRRPGQTPAQEEERFPGPDGSWAAEWAEFESAIAERREPIGSGADGLAALRAVRAIYRAAAERRAVRLEEEETDAEGAARLSA